MLLEQCVMLYEMYLETMGKSESTLRNYHVDGMQFLKFARELFERTFDITEDTDAFYALCINYTTHLNHSFKANTANRKRSNLRSFIKYLYFRNWIEKDFSDDLLHLDREFKDINMISEKTVEKVEEMLYKDLLCTSDTIQKLKHFRNYLILLIFKEFGIKTSDILELTWGHIQEKDNVCYIYTPSKQRLLCTPELHKVIMEYRACYYERFKKIERYPLWTNSNLSEPNAIEGKVLERLFAKLSCKFDKKITPMSYRYRHIHKIDQVKKSVSDKAAIVGYSQSSVYIEKRNRIKT
ncbi:tyrosine-type recombinase/integrase [Lysinibacillus sp. UGB7]|uniref:tyrosine-type recombinase/integrase n=1 Tax=Lysinibacillus sp. UGB7 TaxID=3411039 RepID=UPI003B7AB3CD